MKKALSRVRKKAASSQTLDQELFKSHGFAGYSAPENESLPVTDDLLAFLEMTWPMCASCFNPLNPIWLMQILDLGILQMREHWFVRDGLVPLLWFFKRFPKPPAFQTKLLIDEDLVHLVPSAWSRHVGSYRLYSEVKPQPSSRTALIGLSAEAYLSLVFVKDRLAHILAREKKERIEAMDLFMPVWSSEPTEHNESEQAFHANIYREVFSRAPEKTRVITRGELLGTFDVQKLRLYELNEKLIIADNGMVGELLRKGAQWPESKSATGREEYRKISAFHGFVINWDRVINESGDVATSMKRVSRFYEQPESVFEVETINALPWPRWFAEWAQASASVQPDTSSSQSKKPVANTKKKLARRR